MVIPTLTLRHVPLYHLLVWLPSYRYRKLDVSIVMDSPQE